MKVKVFITGGTIDNQSEKSHPAKEEYTLIPGLLKDANLTAEYSYDILMVKDSSFITDKDRQLILKHCKSCAEKNIVLTGAFVPANKNNSDAEFNLGAAFELAQSLPPGVYISMNGKVFKAGNVHKNFAKKDFEEDS